MKYIVFFLLFTNAILVALEPVILLIGPPGAGKGTFSQHLCEKHGFLHVSAGDLVRREVDEQTPIGLEIAEIVLKGDFIDKKIMNALIEKEIIRLIERGGPLIIDGYVRNEDNLLFQCQMLEKLNLNSRAFVFFLDARPEFCESRIQNRLICPSCNRVYNTLTATPIDSNKCDLCGHDLKVRLNDTPEVIKKRINGFWQINKTLYPKIASLFPVVYYNNSDKTIHESLEDYSQFAQYVLHFSGKVEELTLGDSLSSE